MKRLIKKITIGLTTVTLLFSSFTYTFADLPVVIHEDKVSTNISSGVVHENIRWFTSLGWQNINVLRVNLDDEYTTIDTIFNKDGLSNKQRVSGMVKDSGAVAGINGDFFSSVNNPSPLGTMVKDGEIVSYSNYLSDTTPMFTIDNNKNPFISFWNSEVLITPEGKEPIKLSGYNKDSRFYNEIIVYDKNWSTVSLGNSFRDDLMEVVVIDDVVSEIRTGMEPIPIPENGYIIAAGEVVHETLLSNFKVGDKVKFEIKSQPIHENIEAAIGSGTLLVKEGKISQFSNNIRGNHPRTALGISKDKKQLIMVTVDGRHESFKGVTQEELAEIMISLGSYEAVNLDGGGSTTMAVMPKGAQSSTVVNIPSDGGERAVLNGLGVFSDAPIGNINSIKLSVDDENVFINTTRELKIKAYDKYYNLIDLDIDRVSFYIESNNGTITDSLYKPSKAGKVKIKAKLGMYEDTIELDVLDNIEDIKFDTDRFWVNSDSKKTFNNIYGINNEGFRAKIDPKDISWTVNGDIGKITNGEFLSNSTPSSGALTATLGNAVENILVSVGYEEFLLEDFESLKNIGFISYPVENVPGEIKTYYKDIEGSSSLRLDYDFTKTDDTRAAYVVFEENITIKDAPDKLGLWVYGNNNNHWLRGQIVDANGSKHNVNFANSINWDDWKWVEATLPKELAYPINIERLYIVETNKEAKDKGYILFDGLKSLYKPIYSDLTLPSSTTVKDEKEKHVELNNDGYKFIVSNGITTLNTLLEYQISNRLKNIINTNGIGIITSGMNEKFYNKINVPLIRTDKVRQVSDKLNTYKNSNTKFIQIDNTVNGIRETNYNQWSLLSKELENTLEKNIVILMPKPVFGANGFKDKLEAELFHDTLSKYEELGKDIWIIYGGNNVEVNIKDGIRYMSIGNDKISNTSQIFNLNYVEFTVKNDDITYEIKPLFK